MGMSVPPLQKIPNWPASTPQQSKRDDEPTRKRPDIMDDFVSAAVAVAVLGGFE